MTDNTKGMIGWLSLVGPVVAALTFLIGSGFCVQPWDIQSRAGALRLYETKAEAGEVHGRLGKQIEDIETTLNTVRDNTIILLERVNELRESKKREQREAAQQPQQEQQRRPVKPFREFLR